MIKTYKEYKELAIDKAIVKQKHLSFDKIDDRYYYIYRITNMVDNKHYYGSRVSKIHPKDDIGIKYFSSSTDKKFKQDQKENPQNYKYKVVKIFDNNSDKVCFECYLHQYFNVKSSNSFYNKTNQTPVGFDMTGVVSCVNDSGDKIVLTSLEFNKRDDVISVNKLYMTPERIQKISKNLGRLGVKHSEETKKKISVLKTGTKLSPHSEETKKKISVAQKGIKRKPHTEEHKKRLSENSMDKVNTLNIHIYNDSNTLIYISNGNFGRFCKEYDLPGSMFIKSYRSGGKPIEYNFRSGGKTKAIKNGYINYEGWYAIVQTA